MVQSNKKNEEAPNEDQTVNYWPNAYSKNVHKKLVEIDWDIRLMDFDI